MDQLAEEAVVFFGFGFWFCILPSLLIGLGMWDEKNRKYKYLLGGNMRYMPFKERPWKKGEKWQLYGIGSLMAAFSAFIIFASVTLMMSGTGRAVYMFRSSSAFFVFCLSIGSSICFISAGMTALCIYICGLRLLWLFYGWELSGL